jgi:NADH:ubiquinone oxidoreductase subunit 3 (subunit A)
VIGILLVIVFAVIIQLLVALSTYFAKAGLAAILLIIYLIILFYALGFLVLASGTKKLNAIEKVKP